MDIKDLAIKPEDMRNQIVIFKHCYEISVEDAYRIAQRKLLDVLNKILYEICPHKEFPQRNKIDCTLCIMECMSDLDKLLNDRGVA